MHAESQCPDDTGCKFAKQSHCFLWLQERFRLYACIFAIRFTADAYVRVAGTKKAVLKRNLRPGLFRELATSGCLEQEVYLYHLAPERRFITAEPLEDTSVEIGEPLKAMR